MRDDAQQLAQAEDRDRPLESPFAGPYIATVADFRAVLERVFPSAVPEADYVARTFAALLPHGFTADNTIACVGTCRDELCQPLTRLVAERWGEAFNFSSLAGMLFLGRVGFSAAHAHAPTSDGRRRYAYVVMPHIGLGLDGAVGPCVRAGLEGVSEACGALCALHEEMRRGPLDVGLHPDDPEMSLLRMRFASLVRPGSAPDLRELTELAEQAILDDLSRMIELTVDPRAADWAVLSGILVNGSDHANYVRPGTAYAVVSGQRRSL